MTHRLVFFVSALVFLASIVQASAFLVLPVSQELSPNSTFLMGGVMPGETLELVFSDEDGTGGTWNQLEVVSESVPAGWRVSEVVNFAESFSVSIFVPVGETEKLQTIRVRLSESENPLHTQEFFVQVLVKNDLVQYSFSPLQESVQLGKTASYKLVLVNHSLALHVVNVRSSLPAFWFAPKTVVLEPKPHANSVQELVLEIKPGAYGLRPFSFFLDSGLSEKRLGVFDDQLLVYPTLKGKFEGGLFGFSFFSPNLSVFYFLNGVLSAFQ